MRAGKESGKPRGKSKRKRSKQETQTTAAAFRFGAPAEISDGAVDALFAKPAAPKRVGAGEGDGQGSVPVAASGGGRAGGTSAAEKGEEEDDEEKDEEAHHWAGLGFALGAGPRLTAASCVWRLAAEALIN